MTQSKTSVTASQPRGLQPKKAWEPTYYTKRHSNITDGDDVIDFASQWLRVSKGVRAGEPLQFVEWQQWLLKALLERRENNRLRYRRAVVGLPRKQGKSLMGSALALYGLFAGEAGAEVYSAAGDRKQARIVFNEAREQVVKSAVLSAHCKVYRDAIEVPAFNSVYRVLSADAKSQAGLNPSLVIFDELWVQRNDDLYDQLTLGSGARVDPMIVSITTAGYDINTLCGRLYDYGKSVAMGEQEDENFGFFWWEAPADCSITDKAVWAKCNPNLASKLIDEDDLETSARQSSEMAFRRFRLNQWVRAEESWLPAGAWERLAGEVEIDPDLETWVGIDMALKHDSIAVVMAQPQGEKVAVSAKIWHPSEQAVDVASIEHYLREIHLNYNIKEFAYDPAYFQRSAEILIDDGLPMVEYPQSGQRMIPACGHTYELIINNKIVHNGSPVFTDQVLSAAQRMTDNGWRLSKGKSRRKIDACIAMVIALDRATRKPDAYNSPSVVPVW
jgi:phage terminase large subunit-like protein